MRVLVQWTKANPSGWQELDIGPAGAARNRWRNLPKKPEPVGNEAIDNSDGWIYDINCQGITFSGSDHYAIEPGSDPVLGEFVKITTWNDDPEDWPPGTRYAIEWVLYDPAPDPALGGIMNTRQVRRFWAEDQAKFPEALPYDSFVVPPANITRHGIWITDSKASEHVGVRGSVRGWREWIK